MHPLKSLAMAVLLLGLSACATLSPQTNSQPTPNFDLVSYFRGRTYAYGLFEGRDSRLVRSFTVVADGVQSGDTFTLYERFLWNDGERQTRTWVFQKAADGHWQGRAGDVDGVAQVTTFGNAMRIAYGLRLPFGKSTITVHVDDWSHLFADGAVINRADVSKFGVHVGRITLTFIKPDQKRPIADAIAADTTYPASSRP